MSSSSLIAMRDDIPMNANAAGPRAGGPTSRRSFTPAQKLDHLAAYETSMSGGQGGAYLRVRACIPHRSLSGGGFVTRASSRAGGPGTRSGDSPLSSPRSPGFDAGWRPRSCGWPGRRWRWRSREKHESSWSKYPRARQRRHRPRGADGYVPSIDGRRHTNACSSRVGWSVAGNGDAEATSTADEDGLGASEQAQLRRAGEHPSSRELGPVR